MSSIHHQMINALTTQQAPESVCKLLGRYNDAPEGFREVTYRDWVENTLFHSYTPEFIAYKQIRTHPNESFLSGHLYIFHDCTGYMLVREYDRHTGYKMRYFTFGCAHQYRSYAADEARAKGWPFTPGRCMHHQVCVKCDHKLVYDSSD